MTLRAAGYLLPFLIRREEADHISFSGAALPWPFPALASVVRISQDPQSPGKLQYYLTSMRPQEMGSRSPSLQPLPALCQLQKTWRNFPFRAIQDKGWGEEEGASEL